MTKRNITKLHMGCGRQEPQIDWIKVNQPTNQPRHVPIIHYRLISPRNEYHDEGVADLLFRPSPRPKPKGALSFLVLPWLLWLQCEEWTWPLCVLEFVLLEFTLMTYCPFPWPLAYSPRVCESPFVKFEFLAMFIIPVPSSDWPISSMHSTSSL